MNFGFVREIIKSGGTSIKKCFQCGSCTAICPLSTEGEEFPRKIIRYTTLGLEDKVLSSPELWSCYYCGDCSETCPRDADPGAFMMAARRYAIQKYSWGKTGAMDSSRTMYYGVLAVLSIFIASIILMFHGPMSLNSVNLFLFTPMDIVDRTGLVMGAFVGVSALANLVIMNRYLSKHRKVSSSSTVYSRLRALVKVIVGEVAIEKRLNKCTDKNRYWAHLFLVWGFGGLLVATTLDYMIDAYGLALSIYIPRGLGIAAGLALIYGSAYFIYKRLEGKEEYSTYTHFTDWTFLLLLLLIGVTGFLVDLFVLEDIPVFAYATYSLHLILVFDLLITAPFTKFAHALYRPLALWTLETNRAAESSVPPEVIAIAAV
jgi:nitrate reductase gamma subunit